MLWLLSPEARFVTGNAKYDAHLHHVLIDYGIEIDLNFKTRTIENYRVVDEKKFAWFLLRWT